MIQGNLDTEGEARGVQIHIYTDNEVFNLFKLCALYGALYGNEVFNGIISGALYGFAAGVYGNLDTSLHQRELFMS